MNRIIKQIIGGVATLVVGVIFLSVFTVSFVSNNQKKENYVETTATVVDHLYNDEGLSAYIVEYEVDGRKYNKASNSYSSIFTPLGTGIKIYYNEDNPNDAVWGTDINNIIFIIIGIVFTLVGLVFFINSFKAYKAKVEERDNLIKQSMQNNQDTQNNQNVQTNPNNQQIEEINLSDINK